MSGWRLEFATGDGLVLWRGVAVIGRSATCDVVLDDPAISRRQLLLQVASDGVMLVNVGRQVVHHNDQEIDEPTLALDGDRIAIGGEAFAVVRAAPVIGGQPRWILRLDGGLAIKIRRAPFLVGGGAADDLTIDGWPSAALSLHDVGAGLVMALAPAASALLQGGEGAAFDDGGLARLTVGERVHVGGRSFSVIATGADLEGSTLLGGGATASEVELRICAHRRGGTLRIREGGRCSEVVLAKRRFSLVQALLCPQRPAMPGDFVAVETLCRVIWPDDPGKDESDFNVLLYRVRRDFLRAGIDANEVIERGRGAGVVRSPVAAIATMIIS